MPILSLLLLLAAGADEPKPKPIPEVDALKIENIALRAQVLELEYRRDQERLRAEFEATRQAVCKAAEVSCEEVDLDLKARRLMPKAKPPEVPKAKP